MKKILSTAAILFALIMTTGRTAGQQEPLTKNATYQKDTTIKAQVYKIYVGAKGGRFIIVTSHSGNQYKKYLAH